MTSILTHTLLISNYQSPNQIGGLWHDLLFKNNMLVELCVGNYIISNDLVNSANKPFENYKRSFPKLLTWINFHNLQIRINTRIKTCMCTKTCWHLTKKLSPTELKIVSY